MNVDSNANFVSKIVKTVAPKMAGIARKNENLAASFFAMPRINKGYFYIKDLDEPYLKIICNVKALRDTNNYRSDRRRQNDMGWTGKRQFILLYDFPHRDGPLHMDEKDVVYLDDIKDQLLRFS